MFREYYEEMNNLNSDAFSAENLIKDHTSLEGEGLDIQEIKFSVQIWKEDAQKNFNVQVLGRVWPSYSG